MKIERSFPNKNGGEDTVKYFPAKFEVCPTCKGHGHVADSDLINCPECDGNRVIKVIDMDACSLEEINNCKPKLARVQITKSEDVYEIG